MKRKKIIISFAVLIIFLLTVYFYLNKTVTKPPERLANVPEQAEWVGGADGGSWYQIAKVVSKNTFRVKVYNESNGELGIDTTFILNPDCSFKEIDSALLVKSINGYDGEKILLTLPEKGKRCFLIVK